MRRTAVILLIATLSIGIMSGCGEGSQQSQSETQTQADAAAQTETQTQADDQSAQVTGTVPDKSLFINSTVKDLDLNDAALSDYIKNNKVTMINIWGTFCGPCISEMPELGNIERKYKNRGFEIVGLTSDIADPQGNYDESIIEDARSIIEDTGITYPVLVPPVQLMIDLDIQYVPTTYFLDSEGNVLGSAEIGSKTGEEWEEIIEKYLSQES